MQELEELLNIIIAIQGILVIAFIIQLIANLVIIFQLPKIKNYNKLIFEKLYDFEEDEEEIEKSDEKIEALKMVYGNNIDDETIEKYTQSLDKETIELIIAIVLVGGFVIMLSMFIIK